MSEVGEVVVCLCGQGVETQHETHPGDSPVRSLNESIATVGTFPPHTPARIRALTRIRRTRAREKRILEELKAKYGR